MIMSSFKDFWNGNKYREFEDDWRRMNVVWEEIKLSRASLKANENKVMV